ncbi:MAG: hypothetical protein GXO78_03920 [Calditrichaeota bacterium]|nr:hypothetical protein [Calditrichota bacterium]
MHQCDKFRVYFSSYIEGELHSEQRKYLEAHLAVCPECSEAVYQIKIIRESLRRLPTIQTSDGFETRLHYRINQLNQQSTSPFFLIKEHWKIPALGSAILLLVVTTFIFFNPGDQQASRAVQQNLPAVGLPARSASVPGSSIGQATETEDFQTISQGVQSQGFNDSLKSHPPKRVRKGVQLVGDQ